MKKLVLTMTLLSSAFSSCKSTTGAESTANVKTVGGSSDVKVNNAHYDAARKLIVINVTYGGGFVANHKFKLELGGCLESLPPQCDATLLDTTVDGAEALKTADITMTLSEAGLDENYYSRASLTILGKNKSSATISLPVIN